MRKTGCEAIDLGDVVELRVTAHDPAYQFVGATYDAGFSLRNDGQFSGSSSPSPRPTDGRGCARRDAALALIRALQRIAPPSQLPILDAAEARVPPRTWTGNGTRQIQIVWVTRTEVRGGGFPGDTPGLAEARSEFFTRSPSDVQLVQQKFRDEPGVPEVSFLWDEDHCGHCGPNDTEGRVRADGWFLVRRRYDGGMGNGPGESWSGGRFDPAQTRRFNDWMTRRGWQRVEWMHTPMGGPPRSPEERASFDVWRDVTGLNDRYREY